MNQGFSFDESDVPPFTPLAYARDSWAVVLVALLCLFCVASMLIVLGVGAHAAVFVTLIVALSFITMGAIDYVRRASFYHKVSRLIEHVTQIGQFTSLIDEPDFLEGQLTFRSIERLTNIANDEASTEREQARAHHEYIELWIHEVKTPIAAAKLILSSMHGEQAAKLNRELERIEAQVEQALYASRASSLASDYSIRDIALTHIAREACKKNARFLIERGVTLNMEMPDDMHVLADEQWCAFMLSQVIVNAGKYDARNLTLSAWEEEAGTPRGRTVLEVRDDGCGIPAADVPRVFDRGFTGEVGRAHGSATGMGLYLVADMCARMGVGVKIGSEEGVGTRVLFTFPHNRSRMQ